MHFWSQNSYHVVPFPCTRGRAGFSSKSAQNGVKIAPKKHQNSTKTTKNPSKPCWDQVRIKEDARKARFCGLYVETLLTLPIRAVTRCGRHGQESLKVHKSALFNTKKCTFCCFQTHFLKPTRKTSTFLLKIGVNFREKSTKKHLFVPPCSDTFDCDLIPAEPCRLCRNSGLDVNY